MDWELYIQHVISGDIPMLPILLLYFLIVYRKRKKQVLAHLLLVFVFSFYLVGILTMTGIWWFRSFSPRFVLMPFLDMLRGPVPAALNLVLFMPLGFMLPALYQSFDKVRKVVVAAFLVSLSIEIVQMFGCGITDINDLITNTAGAFLGYYCYVSFCKTIGKPCRKLFYMEKEPQYEFFCLWLLSLFLMSKVSFHIFQIFFH